MKSGAESRIITNKRDGDEYGDGSGQIHGIARYREREIETETRGAAENGDVVKKRDRRGVVHFGRWKSRDVRPVHKIPVVSHSTVHNRLSYKVSPR
jgi:hypothetical protein